MRRACQKVNQWEVNGFLFIKRGFDRCTPSKERTASAILIVSTAFLMVYMSFFVYTGLSDRLLAQHQLSGVAIFFLNIAASCLTLALYACACNGPVKRTYTYPMGVRGLVFLLFFGFFITGLFISHTKLFYSVFLLALYYFSWQLLVVDRVDFFLDRVAQGITYGGGSVLLLSLILEPLSGKIYFGIFNNPNGMALLAALAMFSGLYLSMRKGRTRVQTVLGMLVGVMGFLIGCSTNSRTFILTLFVAGLGYVLYGLCRPKKKQWLFDIGKIVGVYTLGTLLLIGGLRPVFFQIYRLNGPLRQGYDALKRDIYQASTVNGQTQESAAHKGLVVEHYPSNAEVLNALFVRTEATIGQGREFLEEIPLEERRKGEEGRGKEADSLVRTGLYGKLSEEPLFRALDRLTSRRLSIWTIYLDNLQFFGQQKRHFSLEGYSLPYFSNPHNLYLNVFYDGGLLAGVAFLLLALRAMWYSLAALFSKKKGGINPYFHLILAAFFAPSMLGMGVDPFGNFIYYAYLILFLLVAVGAKPNECRSKK